MDSIEQDIKTKIRNDKQFHDNDINLIDLFIGHIPLSHSEQTTYPFKIHKLLKRDYEIESITTSYIYFINEKLKNKNQCVVGRPFYHHTHDITGSSSSQNVSHSKYYQFIVSTGQECYQFLNHYPLFNRASLHQTFVKKQEKLDYIKLSVKLL